MIANDEKFVKGSDDPILVAIDPVTGFALVEQSAESRDAETWAKVIKENIEGLNCEIIQVTSDEASGITSLTKNILGAHHSPDLFHIQQELVRANSSQLAARIRGAEKQIENKEKTLAVLEKSLEKDAEKAPKAGRPVDYETKIERASE
jgi:hypothetical protein